jgi:hypothetical protein
MEKGGEDVLFIFLGVFFFFHGKKAVNYATLYNSKSTENGIKSHANP